MYHINIIMPYRYANGLTIMYNEYNQYKHEIVLIFIVEEGKSF